jgi:hypothetical protein
MFELEFIKTSLFGIAIFIAICLATFAVLRWICRTLFSDQMIAKSMLISELICESSYDCFHHFCSDSCD